MKELKNIKLDLDGTYFLWFMGFLFRNQVHLQREGGYKYYHGTIMKQAHFEWRTLVMSPSWNFLARAKPSYEGSEPSRAELGHFKFRAETELSICMVIKSFFSSRLIFFLVFLISRPKNQLFLGEHIFAIELIDNSNKN